MAWGREYDPSKDKCVKQLFSKKIDDKTTLELGIYSYDNGPKKVRMIRIQHAKNGNKYPNSLINLDVESFKAFREHIEAIEEELGL